MFFCVCVCGGLVFFYFEGEMSSLYDQVVCLPVLLTLFDISGGMTYSSEALELWSSQAFILVK